VARVLLTGGAGFIGSHLAASLLADGWDVDVVDDLSTGSRSSVPDGAGFFELDLGQRESIAALPDREYAAILHLAGQSSGEKSFDSPVRDFDANARSTLMLADWGLRREVPAFIHASSMGVYGQPGELPVGEHIEPRPISWYGGSKLAAERVLQLAGQEGMRTVSMRMFSIYGPGQDLAEMRQGMVSIFLAMLLRGEPVDVHGALDRVRDFVYVDDCVAAWRVALEREVSGAFNIGTGVGTSVGDLIAQLIDVAGLPADHPVTATGTTPGDQTAMIADPGRAVLELGWEARTVLRDGLEAMVRWARDV
jgi:UDP-glucose 4-epimerase